MTVTVPSWDVVPYNLQQSITNKNTQLTNPVNALNGALVQALQMDYYNLQLQLVLALLGTGALSPATILSTMTYITPNSDASPGNAGGGYYGGQGGPQAGASEGGLI